jgi:hypothetical protein
MPSDRANGETKLFLDIGNLDDCFAEVGGGAAKFHDCYSAIYCNELRACLTHS